MLWILLALVLTPTLAAPVEPQPVDPSLMALSAPAGDAPRIDRFSIQTDGDRAVAGDVVPLHVVVADTGTAARAALHVTVRGPDDRSDLEPLASQLHGPARELLVAFWEPEQAGRYELGGHVHVGKTVLELPDRTEHVEPATAFAGEDASDPLDPSTWAIGIAPGTVLWSLVFLGLAYASQRRRRRDRP